MQSERWVRPNGGIFSCPCHMQSPAIITNMHNDILMIFVKIIYNIPEIRKSIMRIRLPSVRPIRNMYTDPNIAERVAWKPMEDYKFTLLKDDSTNKEIDANSEELMNESILAALQSLLSQLHVGVGPIDLLPMHRALAWHSLDCYTDPIENFKNIFELILCCLDVECAAYQMFVNQQPQDFHVLVPEVQNPSDMSYFDSEYIATTDAFESLRVDLIDTFWGHAVDEQSPLEERVKGYPFMHLECCGSVDSANIMANMTIIPSEDPTKKKRRHHPSLKSKPLKAVKLPSVLLIFSSRKDDQIRRNIIIPNKEILHVPDQLNMTRCMTDIHQKIMSTSNQTTANLLEPTAAPLSYSLYGFALKETVAPPISSAAMGNNADQKKVKSDASANTESRRLIYQRQNLMLKKYPFKLPKLSNKNNPNASKELQNYGLMTDDGRSTIDEENQQDWMLCNGNGQVVHMQSRSVPAVWVCHDEFPLTCLVYVSNSLVLNHSLNENKESTIPHIISLQLPTPNDVNCLKYTLGRNALCFCEICREENRFDNIPISVMDDLEILNPRAYYGAKSLMEYQWNIIEKEELNIISDNIRSACSALFCSNLLSQPSLTKAIQTIPLVPKSITNGFSGKHLIFVSTELDILKTKGYFSFHKLIPSFLLQAREDCTIANMIDTIIQNMTSSSTPCPSSYENWLVYFIKPYKIPIKDGNRFIYASYNKQIKDYLNIIDIINLFCPSLPHLRIIMIPKEKKMIKNNKIEDDTNLCNMNQDDITKWLNTLHPKRRAKEEKKLQKKEMLISSSDRIIVEDSTINDMDNPRCVRIHDIPGPIAIQNRKLKIISNDIWNDIDWPVILFRFFDPFDTTIRTLGVRVCDSKKTFIEIMSEDDWLKKMLRAHLEPWKFNSILKFLNSTVTQMFCNKNALNQPIFKVWEEIGERDVQSVPNLNRTLKNQLFRFSDIMLILKI
eukprot:GHVL01015710.1.p1 GENE.GHVL01015710.1~~GHVL01015710.1.p1  ORF type:complete len:1086 (+),score=237.63 GHVL01015710.1:396-3260(+)